MTMPAGKYWVGDLCYVMENHWDEVCLVTVEDGECLEGEFSLASDVRFAMYRRAHDDMGYLQKNDYEYSVDSGTIGCVRVEDIDDPRAEYERGSAHEFSEDFETGSEGGVVRFGDVSVNTNSYVKDSI